MLKKLTLLGMAIAAMAALVAPAVANATVLKEGTSTVAVGSALTLTQDPSFPVVTHGTTIGDVKCTSIDIKGKVTKNSGGVVEGVGTEGTASPCTVGGESGAKVLNVSGTIFSNTNEKGTATFSFKLELPSGLVCTFETEGPEAGVYKSGTNTISFPNHANLEEEVYLEGGACGEAHLEGGLLVETPNGTAVTINNGS